MTGLCSGMETVTFAMSSELKTWYQRKPEQTALPKSMAPYRKGHLYFHGGASLAEAVVPVIIARLDNEEHLSTAKMSVELSYKNGAKRITTRVPVVEITLVSDDMFAQEDSVEVLIGQDIEGNVVMSREQVVM